MGFRSYGLLFGGPRGQNYSKRKPKRQVWACVPDANASGPGGGGLVAAATRHPSPRDTGMWLAGSVVVGWLGRSRFKNRRRAKGGF